MAGQLEIGQVRPAPTAAETAAVVAAITRFRAAQERPGTPAPAPAAGPWQRAALSEGVRRAPQLTPFWA
jgi:hypothetical protein